MQDDKQQKANPETIQPQANVNNNVNSAHPMSSEIKPSIAPILPFVSIPNNSIEQDTNASAQPQINRATEQPTFTPSSVYPEPSTSSTSDYAPIGLTGSQMHKQKVKVPIGIYLIAGYTLIGVVIGFIDTSQNSTFYTIVMIIDLFLAIGLLMKLEIARKIILWLEAITLILIVGSFFLLIGLQQRSNTLKIKTNTVISNLDQNKLTSKQKQNLVKLQSSLAEADKLAEKTLTLAYFKLGATAVGTIVIIVYLTRPKVKDAFHELES
ncbi:MAG: hypothetical protein WCI60_00435 [bacterium]